MATNTAFSSTSDTSVPRIFSFGEDPRATALMEANINPQANIEISWKQISSADQGGQYINAILDFCDSNNRCRTLGQSGVANSKNLGQSSPRKYSVLNLGDIMNRTGKRDLILRAKLVRTNGLTLEEFDSEKFKLSDLVQNEALITFDNGTTIKIKITN